ncbi:MAG: translation initiation factor IF-1 [Candidatus Vidania fulgoroideorum]
MKNIKIYIGKVIKNLSNSMFLVQVKNKEIVCYISGKIRINYIRIMNGDKVKIEVDSKNENKGRIIYRIK